MSALLALAEDDVTAGPIGLLIVLLLGIALVFLFRSMTKRIKRLPPSFPGQDDPEERPPHSR